MLRMSLDLYTSGAVWRIYIGVDLSFLDVVSYFISYGFQSE